MTKKTEKILTAVIIILFAIYFIAEIITIAIFQ